MTRMGFGTLVLERIGSAAFSFIFVIVAIFMITSLLPGDVADTILGKGATVHAAAALRHSLALDRPAAARFFLWVKGLTSGDLGRSLLTGRPVVDLLLPRLRNSLTLSGVTALLATPIALALGILCAIFRGSFFDRCVSFLTLAVVSIPVFLIATLSVYIFAVQLHLAPALTDIRATHSVFSFVRMFLIPVLALVVSTAAQMIRIIRASMIALLEAPYIEMARLKGLPPVRIILFSALPNAVAPIVNAIALSLSSLLGDILVVETVFHYPGVASLMVDAVATRDVPVVQSCALIFSFAYLAAMVVADIVGMTVVRRQKGVH